MKISYSSEPGRDLIGEQIYRLRKERHLSQQSLAAKPQVLEYSFSELTILRIEKSQRLATDIELETLCDYFNVKPNQMLGFDD